MGFKLPKISYSNFLKSKKSKIITAGVLVVCLVFVVSIILYFNRNDNEKKKVNNPVVTNTATFPSVKEIAGSYYDEVLNSNFEGDIKKEYQSLVSVAYSFFYAEEYQKCIDVFNSAIAKVEEKSVTYDVYQTLGYCANKIGDKESSNRYFDAALKQLSLSDVENKDLIKKNIERAKNEN